MFALAKKTNFTSHTYNVLPFNNYGLKSVDDEDLSISRSQL